jgi:YidC/Oxa1 family membrane protein insertase
MDKNTFTGLFLIMVIMGASIYFMKPSEADIKKEQLTVHQDSIKKGLIKAENAAAATAAIKTDTAKKTGVVDSAVLKTPFGAATVGTEQFVTIGNKELSLKLSTKGGRIFSAELKNYKTFDKKPLILFDGNDNKFGITLKAGDKNLNTNDLYFTPSAPSLQVAEQDSGSVTMRLSYSPTQYIDYIYTLKGTGFKLGLTIKSTGLDQVVANSSVYNLNWAASLHKQEKDIAQERQYTTVYFKNTDNEVDYLSETKDEQKVIADKKVQWVAFKQHFFSNVLIVKDGIGKSDLAVATDVADTSNVKQMKADLTLTP